MKFFLRKIGFLLVLGLLAATPWIIAEVERATTTNPHILMAREIATFPISVNVLNVFLRPESSDHLVVLLHIPKYPDWTGKDRENLKRFILQIVRGSRYTKIDIAIGWDYTAETMRAQGAWKCSELSTTSCEWLKPNAVIKPEFIKWPKEGRP